jgi:hypothetical protein
MPKPKLLLQRGYKKYGGWNWTLTRMVANSNVFDVEEADFPYARCDGARNANWTVMEVDGVRIGLDSWDTLSPTAHFHGAGYFKKDGILKDIDMLIKIQYHPCKYWDDFQKDTGIKVNSWTVMPTKDFPLESFQWENKKKFKWVTTVTGKNNRFGRQPWTDWCGQQDDFFSSGEYLVNDTLDSYVDRLKDCKWGMILKGKNGAVKNRRECEFASCGIPLALNYDPHYPWGMVPDVHYVKLNKPEDMAKLREIDPEPYARASRRLYYDRFSPYGMANTLLELARKL